MIFERRKKSLIEPSMAMDSMTYYLQRKHKINATADPVRFDSRLENTSVQLSNSENHSRENASGNSSSLWTKATFIIALLAMIAFIVVVLIVPFYLVPLLTPTTTIETSSTASTTTPSTTVTTTAAVTLYVPSNYNTACTAQCTNVTTTSTASSVLASWKFEYTLSDSVGSYHGSMSSAATYVTGYVGQALAVNSTKYVTLSSYLSFNNRSFTIEAWIYITSTLSSSTDYGIFNQCQTPGTRTCLSCLIRTNKFIMGFYNDDITANTTLSLNNWIHFAFVYDMTTNTKSIYYNGILDGFVSTGSSYQGTNATTYIGYAYISGGVTPLPGYIDQVTVSNRAKTACEILNDATLVSRFPFDGGAADVGPNNLPSYTTAQSNSGVTYPTGRVNQALLLSTSNAFFQSCGYTAIGVSNKPFSFALWINPTSIGGTILHVSTDQSGSGGWCLPFIGFSSNGSVVAQSWLGSVVAIIGPQIPTNNWTHIVQTWSSSNGLRLYVNGGLYGSATMATYNAGAPPECISLGTSVFGTYCNTGQIVMGKYFGALDEFYVYNRELTADEVCLLAHP